MKRGVGVSAIMKKRNAEKKYDTLSKQMEKTKLDSVNEVMTTFKKTLEDFAGKHREKINSDPEFRQQFHKMCVSVGVDPLASSKGFWADLLGVGSFYFELGILVIQISLQTRVSNGGIISIQEILKIITTTGGKNRKDVSEEDIRRSVEKVSILGSGFKIVDIRGNSMLLSVPLELNRDHEILLAEGQDNQGFVTEDLMIGIHSWTTTRFAIAMNTLLSEGMAWIDIYDGQKKYYFPSVWNQL